MKINVEDGTLVFAAGAIRPGLDKQTFLNSPVGADAQAFLMNKPHSTYRIFPEQGIAATVQFTDDVLETVEILFVMKGDSAENWSEAHELARKEVHDAWLRNEIGPPPYRYTWGRLESSYDAKACVSDILVSFDNRPRF
jgi:hypothetical protein